MEIIVMVLICFVLSAFFSAAEMAFVSCNKLRVKHHAAEAKKEAIVVQGLQRHPKDVLAAVLFGNNLVNVTIAALTALLFHKYLGIENELLVTLVVAPFIIIFAEAVPKDFGRQKADEIIYKIGPVLVFFHRLFKPFTAFILGLTDSVMGLFGKEEKKSLFVTKEEFHYLLEESARRGVIKEHEKRLVDTILNFERIRVEEVMVPLPRAAQLEMTKKIGDLKDLAKKSHASYVLVYEEIPSIIVGAIYVFDTLFERDEQKALTPFLRAPLFIDKELSAEKAFLKLQENRQSFAVVVDENREAVGVVAIDNLLAL